MTKDEKTKRVVRDGVEYLCSPVKHDRKQVGFAPRICFYKEDNPEDALDAMLQKLGAATVFSLADRQYDQDSKNKVRAKFTKEAVTASAVIKALNKGTLKSTDVEQVMKIKGLEYIQAAASLMGVGKEAEIEPDKIHWDIL